MPIGRKALLGTAVGIGAITGFSKGVRGDGELHRNFMDFTLGDPDADQYITGARISIRNMIAQNVMPFSGVTTRLGRATNWRRGMQNVGGAIGGGIGGTLGAPFNQAGLGFGAGSAAGSIMGGLAGGLGALNTGFINSTTLGDYGKYNPNEMPYVPGDVVLGMYNMRHR